MIKKLAVALVFSTMVSVFSAQADTAGMSLSACLGIPPVPGKGVILGGKDISFDRNWWIYTERVTGSCQWTCAPGFTQLGYTCVPENQQYDKNEFIGVAFGNPKEAANSSNVQTVSSFDENGGTEIVEDIANSDIEVIESGGIRNIKSVVIISQVILGIKCDDTGKITDLWVDHDKWERYAVIIAPYLKNIKAFYVFDEPYWNATVWGLTFKKVRSLLDEAGEMIKATFPEAKIMGAFAITRRDVDEGFVIIGGVKYFFPPDAQEFYGFPEKFDYISHDYYFAYRYDSSKPDGGVGEYVREYREIFLANFYSERLPYQQYFFIPDAYQYRGYESQNLEYWQSQLVYYWASIFLTNQTTTVGMIAFLYSSFTDESIVGMESLAKVREVYFQFGAAYKEFAASPK